MKQRQIDPAILKAFESTVSLVDVSVADGPGQMHQFPAFGEPPLLNKRHYLPRI